MSQCVSSNWNILVVSAVLIFSIIVVRTAWVSDDAYITFRTVDNIVNGYGPTWNVAERVQVYTHPLWMLLTTSIYFATREIYFTSISVSIVMTLLAVGLFAFGVARSPAFAFLGIVILAFSRAFVDYSTSGLENPLTHLLLGGFLYIYFRAETTTPRSLFLLALIGGLGVLNRLDTFLLFAPVILHGLLALRSLKGIAIVLLGFLPMMMWEIFSLIYYGFLFPNSAYAKLDVGISRSELVQQGSYYFWNTLRWDPVTLVTISLAIAILLVTREVRHLYVALGILFYIVYVLLIGGDFMSGRFLTAPLFAAVIMLSTTRIALPNTAVGIAFAAIVIIGLNSLHPPLFSDSTYGSNRSISSYFDNHGVADERAFFYPTSGLLRSRTGQEMPTHQWANEGRLQRVKGRDIIIRPNIGFFGFFAGPEVYIADTLGIANPLLARLPATGEWRIGHFNREIPSGYLDSLSTGENRITDPEIADLYDRLNLLTREKIFDSSRIIEILKTNTSR